MTASNRRDILQAVDVAMRKGASQASCCETLSLCERRLQRWRIEAEDKRSGRVGRDLKGSAYYRMKRKLGRRASIEPRISHLKARFRLGRNFLKGVYGDLANVILAASAMNLVNWMGRFLLSIFEMLRWGNKLLETLRVLLTCPMPKFVEGF